MIRSPPHFLGGAFLLPEGGQGWSSARGVKAGSPCAPAPVSPAPSSRGDAVTAGPARAVWLWGRLSRTRDGSSGLCALSGAGRLPTAVLSPWPEPHGHLDHGHGSRLDHSHTPASFPHPHRGLGPPLPSRWGCGEVMGATGKWDPHPCPLEGTGVPFHGGFLRGFKLGWGGTGRGGQGMLGGPCPPPASATWAGREAWKSAALPGRGRRGAPTPLGTPGPLGFSRVPLGLRGHDRDPGLGMRAVGCGGVQAGDAVLVGSHQDPWAIGDAIGVAWGRLAPAAGPMQGATVWHIPMPEASQSCTTLLPVPRRPWLALPCLGSFLPAPSSSLGCLGRRDRTQILPSFPPALSGVSTRGGLHWFRLKFSFLFPPPPSRPPLPNITTPP